MAANVIPVADPRAQYLSRRDAIDAAIARVLEQGRYVLGEETRAFETELAAYVGARFGIGVGSGTEALHLALRACGVGPGDEVITVSHTAVATIAAIELAGAVPVLLDIDPQSMTLDPRQLAEAVGPRTRAIVPVHLYGHPAELDPIVAVARQHDLVVVEDCAQAHGASYRGQRVGALGQAGCFSFYPTKNLGAIGDGGMVVTSDATIADRARALREYGWRERFVSEQPGWNTRLDELQAAVLRVKLPHLDADLEARRHLAALYRDGLAGLGLTLPEARPGSTHAYHLYVVRTPQRDALAAALAEGGIQTQIHYPVPVHLQPAYRGRLRHQDLAETERAAREILSLPIYPELGAPRAQRVIAAIRHFLEKAT